MVEADHAVASRIGSIVYGGDPEAKARANAIGAEAAAIGKLKLELRNLERAVKAGIPADALHDALAPYVLPPADDSAVPDAKASSRFAVHRGQRIHYTVHGNGPLVVLQHGAPRAPRTGRRAASSPGSPIASRSHRWTRWLTG